MVGNDAVNSVDYLGKFLAGTPYSSSRYGFSNSTLDQAQWLVGKLLLGPLGSAAMSHADGSAGTRNWTLSSNETTLVNSIMSNNLFSDATDVRTGKRYPTWIKDELKTRLGSRGAGTYSLHIPKRQFHFDWGTDGYFAFGDAEIEINGKVKSASHFGVGCVGLEAEVKLTDHFSFAAYGALGRSRTFQPTAVGFRLQDSGYLQSFNTKGTWKITRLYAAWILVTQTPSIQ